MGEITATPFRAWVKSKIIKSNLALAKTMSKINQNRSISQQ